VCHQGIKKHSPQSTNGPQAREISSFHPLTVVGRAKQQPRELSHLIPQKP
jgi:hypothetical protein